MINYRIIILNMYWSYGLKQDKPKGCFRVDRYTSLGNPFEIGKDGDRNQVCDKYEVYFHEKLINEEKSRQYLNFILSYLKKNKTVYLLCWCSPKRCHAETIKRWLEKEIQNEEKEF